MLSSGKIKRIVLLLGDIASFYAAFILGLFLRYGFSFRWDKMILNLRPFTVYLGLILLFYLISHLYESEYTYRQWKLYRNIGESLATVFIIAALTIYLTDIPFTPRRNLIYITACFGIIDVLWRVLFGLTISKSRPAKLAIVGESPRIDEFYDYTQKNPQFGYTVISVYKQWEAETKESILGQIENKRIDCIAVNHLDSQPNIHNELADSLKSKVRLVDWTSVYAEVFKRIPLDDIDKLWVARVAGANENTQPFNFKRLFDIILAALGLIVCLPFWLLAAILIKLTSKGPVFYLSERVGQWGKPFKIIKLRTMVFNAKDIGPSYTLAHDPRITFIGRILRKTHLDETPQFINILKGELSFVGPRPEETKLAREYEKGIPYYTTRYLVKPGVTGWAQINYAQSTTIAEAKTKLEYDFYYLKSSNPILDIIIILKTLRVALEMKTN